MLQSFKYIYLLFLLSILAGTTVQAQCTLTATSSGGNAAYTQVYVLVDASNNNIVAQNTTGTFTSVAVGNYNIHALNYDPSNPPAPLPSALIGLPVSDVGSTVAGCFNADFLIDIVARNCSNPSCAQSSDICQNTSIVATSSGGNAAYTQVYVLADDSGNFVAQNDTGTFPTASLTIGNTYQVHALNYDPSNPPTTLPSDLSAGDPLSNITGGCFNSDFLTDYVCFNIIVCACTDVCNTTSISATSSGGNAAYTQVYVLADDSGNFVAQNNTGTFPAASLTIGNIYQVHALNYDPSNPPTTLPIDLSAGDPLSNITGGCFNSDFLTDFVCFNIIACACTDVCNTASIVATSSGGNAAYTQVYVLADDTGNFVAQNNTGTFPAASLTIGNIYQVHALNYDPSNPPTTLPIDLSAGDPLSNITGGCFNSDFLTDFVCFNIIVCACTDVCNTASIVATSSGGNAAYTQVYVLADDTGNFVAQNNTGTFPAASLTTGNTYQVHALNYDPSNPPTTLPSDLSAGDPLSNITGGCFNSDFLTDYVCFDIICCGGPTGFLR